jgi:hypothetical protein
MPTLIKELIGKYADIQFHQSSFWVIDEVDKATLKSLDISLPTFFALVKKEVNKSHAYHGKE